MKKILSILFLGFILTSCSQDMLENSLQEKGTEVTATIALNVAPMKKIACGDNNTKGRIESRSVVTSTVDDQKILDLWVVQFDNSGNYMKKEYFKDFKGSTIDARLGVNAAGSTSTVYLIANVGATMVDPNSEADFKTKFRRFYSESEILPIDPVTSKKCVPMLGILTGVTVTTAGFLEKIDVTLIHILSKIVVDYTIPSTTNFKIESVRLRNVPTAYTFAPPVAATTTPTSTIAVVDFNTEGVNTTTGTMVYLVPENQKGIGTNTGAAHNDRMKEGLGTTSATYVEFSGHVIGERGGDKIVYSFYPGADNYNDYNIVRNTEYTLSVTLDGTSASDRRVSIPERTNCYWVPRNTTFEIPVTRANESDLGLQIPDTRTGWTASVLWSTPLDGMATVSNSTKGKGYFMVTSGLTAGNALVVIKNDAGDILWSWHIWVDDGANSTTTFSGNAAYVWMDRNLGAVSAANTAQDFGFTSGMYYQWGRKDPFTQSSASIADPVASYRATYNGAGALFDGTTVKMTYPFTVSTIANDPMTRQTDINAAAIAPLNGLANSLKLATRYPNLFLGGWRGSTARDLSSTTTGYDSWGGGYMQCKTVYDPCPVGWRVPSGKKVNTTNWYSPWSYNSVTANVNTPRSTTNYANMSIGGSTTYWQAAGYRHPNGHIYYVGLYAYYWFATSASASGAYAGFVGTGTSFSKDDTDSKDFGFNIRCVKDN